MSRWTPRCSAPSRAALRVSCRWRWRHPRIRQKESTVIKKSVTISNKLGLHARASAKLTKLAGSYPCEVWLSRGDRRVNAKSIMGVMMLAAGIGVTVEIETNGECEQEALDAIVALMNDKFGEGE